MRLSYRKYSEVNSAEQKATNRRKIRREAVGLSNGFWRFAKRYEKSSFFTMKFNLVVSKGVRDEDAD